MELIDNINRLLGDDLKQTLKPGARMKIAASCFSMYAFEGLKAELEKIDELQFVYLSACARAKKLAPISREERAKRRATGGCFRHGIGPSPHPQNDREPRVSYGKHK
ncbi:MAG: hypothetical protein PHG39_09045 [Acidithiobacillus ferrooxidans]|nr:hypothetical protein [Acidithiobacillus ferrooxidans]